MRWELINVVANEEVIRDLASKPGMTYTRMAKALQIDKDKAKKMCEGLGIQLGKKLEKKVPEVKTEPVNRDQLLARIEALEKKYEDELKENNKLQHQIEDLGLWAENELAIIRSRLEKHTHVILNYHDGKEFLEKKRNERAMRAQS